MKNKVSVIIPVYQAEKFIKRCLESVVNQTYENLEIIIINDGSTDNSESIINQFKDKRIKYFKKENSGPGATRNLGIEKATGDYLMFLDADDYLELNTIEKLINKCLENKCDLVIMDMLLETSKKIELKTVEFADTNLKERPDLITKISLGPCNKIYHKSLFKDKDNRFIVGLKYEDAPLVIHSLLKAKNIGQVRECLYHYVIQTTGETINRDESVLDIIKICQIIENKIKGYDYINKTDLMVKILMPYLKNSRFIKDSKLRNKLIKEIYIYLKRIDKNWRKCNYLKEESKNKSLILKHKFLLTNISNIYASIKN